MTRSLAAQFRHVGPRGRLLRVSSAAGALAIALAACGADRPAPDPALEETPPEAAEVAAAPSGRDFDAQIHEFLPRGPSGLAEVRGMLHNRTTRRFSNVVVDITILDEAGDSIGTTEVRARNLDPDGVFMFNSPVFVEGGVAAEIASVQGY